MESKSVEILLTEDDPSDIKLTLKAFQKYSLADKVTVLKDGEEALESLFSEGRYEDRNNKNMPKVIFPDLKLPFVDGVEVLCKFNPKRAQEESPSWSLRLQGRTGILKNVTCWA